MLHPRRPATEGTTTSDADDRTLDAALRAFARCCERARPSPARSAAIMAAIEARRGDGETPGAAEPQCPAAGALNARASPPCSRRLGDDDRWGYRTLTFPACRPLLDRLADPDTIALAVDDQGGNPLALALGYIDHAGEAPTARLASIFVHAAWRRRGIAGRLLADFGAQCRRQHCVAIDATYMTGSSSTPAVEALLAGAGWSAPETRMLVVQATLDSIRAAPWIRNTRLPDTLRILPWHDVGAADRAALAASQGAAPWIPPDLLPFDHEAHAEPHTSLALKADDRIIGWTINHRVGNVLRYTCSFMHPRWQRRGHILLLYNAAVARMPDAGLDTGMWTVPLHHAAMAAFARKWMAPYATRFDETRGSRRVLG